MLRSKYNKRMKINNFWTKVQVLVGIVSIIVACVVAWHYNRDRETSLNIEQVNATLLTQNFEVEGLTAKYQYCDSIEVENLWKTVFVIKNTGDQTLYGSGFSEMNIRNGVIPLVVSRCGKLLNIRIINNAEVSLNRFRELVVAQWRPNEYVEIEMLTEGDSVPLLTINERGIQNATITYSQYSPTKKNDNRLIDYVPHPIKKTLMCGTIFVLFVFVIAIAVQIPAQLRGKQVIVKVISTILFAIFICLLLCPLLWMF